jgi:hypothetical protein
LDEGKTMSNAAQQKAAAAFDNTKTAKSITIAKRGIFVIFLILAVGGIVLYVNNIEASATAYRLTNTWVQDDDYRDLVPMIRNALDNGVLNRNEWWEISARQEEIAQTKQREELLKTVIQGLP